MAIRRIFKEIIEALHQELFAAREGPKFHEVRRRIAEGRHAIVPALKQISLLSTSIDHSPGAFKEIVILSERGRQPIPVPNWALAFVAKEIVYVGHSNFEQPISDGLLAFYSNWYTNIRDPRSILAAFSKAKRRRRAQSILIRMDYEQIALQRLSPIAEIARALILHGPQYDESGRLLFDPASEFLSLTGLNLIEFMAIGFAAHARVQQFHDPGFTASSLTPVGSPGGALSPDKVAKFLTRAASDYDEFRWNVDQEESSLPGYEKYALNPLYRTPIIETHITTEGGEALLVAPVPSMLMYRVTHGIYWDLLSRWSDEVALIGRNNAPDFPSFFGQAFERYVGQLLNEILPPGSVLSEQRYGPRSRARDSCDWIVIEGNTAILIECKTSRFHLATKATGDPEAFLRESEAIYGKALVQLLQTRRAIESGDLSLPKSPTQYLGLVVIFDHLLMASPHLREDLLNIVPTIDSTFSSNDIADLDFRILPIRLLENFSARAASLGLRAVFQPSNWNTASQGGHNLPSLLKDKFREFEAHMRRSFPS